MENYIKIEEELKNLSVEGICNKGKSALRSILFILIGVALFVVSLLVPNLSDILKMSMIVAGIGLFLYGIIELLLGMQCNKFIYQPTGKRLKAYNIYIKSDDRSKTHDLFNDRNFIKINELHKTMTSGCLLKIMATDDGKCCVLQMQELVMDEFEPTSLSILLTGEQAAIVHKFMKS